MRILLIGLRMSSSYTVGCYKKDDEGALLIPWDTVDRLMNELALYLRIL